jgi:hypothetical protein
MIFNQTMASCRPLGYNLETCKRALLRVNNN